MKTMTYHVVIEWAQGNYSAFVPDLPGCVTTGRSVEQTLENMREAIALHLEGMLEDGEPVPESSAVVREISVEVAA